MKYFMGIDLGTQSSKGLLFSPEGDIVASSSIEYIPEFPKPGWAECDVAVWKNAFVEILNRLVTNAGIQKKEIGMICFASLCGCMVPVNKKGEALDKCMLWIDKRADAQCESIRNIISDDEAFELIGSSISASIRCMKILWLKENKPKIYEEADAFLDAGEFMVRWLTGNTVTDYSQGSITGLYDISKREYSEKMFNITGIPREKLPEVKPAAEIAGNIRKVISELTELSEDTLVTVGSGDQFMSPLGTGIIGIGNVLNVMGTSEIIGTISDHPVFDSNKILKPHLHVDPKLWQIEQGAMLSGGAVRWYRDTIARCSFNEMNELAAKAPVGCDGLLFLPVLQGAAAPVFNDKAKGVFFGLHMGHNLTHMTRAVYEGCAFGFRDNIESMKKLGIGNGDIIASGGGINSAIWLQIKSDLIGRKILTSENQDSTAMGAGMVAGVAQGNFKNFEEAAKKLIRYSKTYYPNEKNKALYDEAYGRYRELYFTVEKLFK